MPLPFDPSQLKCIPTVSLPPRQRLRMPGGVEILSFDLLSEIGSALAPLAPVIKILQLLKAIIDAITGVATLNPLTIADALAELGRQSVGLLALLPQVSLIYTVIDSIDLLIHVLGQLEQQLVRLERQLVRISDARSRTVDLNDSVLFEMLVCADDNVARELTDALAPLDALGGVVDIINIFCGLIGVPGIPDLSSIAGDDIDELRVLITQTKATLTTVRDAVPIP